MCRTTDDKDHHWTDQEIANHFDFLLMAAHDTTAIALTTMIWALTAHPHRQARLITEMDALGDAPADRRDAACAFACANRNGPEKGAPACAAGRDHSAQRAARV